MLTPSVGRGSRRDIEEVGAFVTGLIVGGVLLTTGAWLLGGFGALVSQPVRGLVVWIIVALAALRDLRIMKFRLPHANRQVPRTVFERGRFRGSLQFGIELGLIFITHVPSSLPYVLVLALILIPVPYGAALAAGAGIALGRAQVTALRLLSRHGEAWNRRLDSEIGWLVPVCTALGLFAIVMVLVVLGGWQI
jgi:hypothetical protein